MPLARRIVDRAGVTIEGQHFPQGVSSIESQTCFPQGLTTICTRTSVDVCNHAFHNPVVWGEDHNTFYPNRWDDPNTAPSVGALLGSPRAVQYIY